MASYKILIQPSAAKELALIPQAKIREAIRKRISSLASNPKTGSGIAKLSVSDFYYRARRGVYRIVYRVEEPEGVIRITRIRHRKDAYKGKLQ